VSNSSIALAMCIHRHCGGVRTGNVLTFTRLNNFKQYRVERQPDGSLLSSQWINDHWIEWDTDVMSLVVRLYNGEDLTPSDRWDAVMVDDAYRLRAKMDFGVDIELDSPIPMECEPVG